MIQLSNDLAGSWQDAFELLRWWRLRDRGRGECRRSGIEFAAFKVNRLYGGREAQRNTPDHQDEHVDTIVVGTPRGTSSNRPRGPGRAHRGTWTIGPGGVRQRRERA